MNLGKRKNNFRFLHSPVTLIFVSLFVVIFIPAYFVLSWLFKWMPEQVVAVLNPTSKEESDAVNV
jgi:hypothetical protein